MLSCYFYQSTNIGHNKQNKQHEVKKTSYQVTFLIKLMKNNDLC